MDDTSPTAYFGDWLKIRRKALDLTQAELSESAGCSLHALRKIESGHRRPSKQLAGLLAKALDIPEEEQATFIRVARGELNVERLSAPDTTYFVGQPVYQKRIIPQINLPLQTNPFVGREAELAALGKLLVDPQCRLLTITGLGGIGKTRLVIELAAQHQARFPAGIYFVSLVALSSPEYVVHAIADAVRLTFSGDVEPRQQLLNYLRIQASQPVLLLLDGLEHLLASSSEEGAGEDITGWLAKMLLQTPNIKLLVTSRERVNLQGEWIFELSGLPYPAGGQSFDFDSFSASALFVQRARQVKAEFEVFPGELASLAKICELTEGTPLAIELAAAWVGLLTLDEIASEIASNLDFLTSSMRDIPERHRSMRAVFDQSWKMLANPEQQVLGRLSVFKGGFSRQAAEQVAGATLPVLSTLANRTLVRRSSPTKFEMHELVRQYAADRLRTDPQEFEAAKRRHFDFFLAQAETAAQELKGAGQLEWLGRLEQDHDNLRAALAWALENARAAPERGELALRLSGALRWFWRMRGHFHEGGDVLNKALQSTPAAPTAARASALLGLSLVTNALGDMTGALQPAEESASIFREVGDASGQAEALIVAGLTLVWQGNAAAGSAYLEEALAISRAAGSRWSEAQALYRLGSASADYGGDPAGRAMLEESAGILEELGEKYIFVSVLTSLAILDMGSGEYGLARKRFEHSLALAREIKHPWGVADALSNLGGICRIQGDYATARSFLEESQRVYQEHGHSAWETDVLCALAETAIVQGDFPTAQHHLLAAFELSVSSSNQWLQVLVSYFQGLLAYYVGNADQAAGLLEATIAGARQGRYRPDLARAQVTLGLVRLKLGQVNLAVESFKTGLQEYRQLGHQLGKVTAVEGLAQAAAAQADYQQAVMLLAATHRLREALGAPLPPVDRPWYEALLAGSRLELDEAAFADAWKRGAEKSFEQVIEEAAA